jgi:ATP-binding cassette, subfamily G (WHITE), member 2
MFSANLRLPTCVTYQEKVNIVEKVMEDLRITHIADRKIGDSFSRGISGGEKRRVSIGTELVISPHVLVLYTLIYSF